MECLVDGMLVDVWLMKCSVDKCLGGECLVEKNVWLIKCLVGECLIDLRHMVGINK